MTEPYMLDATGLTRRYGGFTALNNVSLRVREGEIRGLIGSNGAGKSTCMDVLTGRGRHPTGTVRLAGRDISHLTERERRAFGLSRSFQKTNIFPELTIREQVELAARRAEIDNTDEVLEELSLAALANRPASDLSYGDQRRFDLELAMVG